MTELDKKSLSEADICDKYITPAIQAAGWDVLTQVRREVHYTKGRIIVRGKVHTRGESKFADYVLYHQPNLPLALVEAKDNSHGVSAGMQQALRYAEDLDIPFALSSNGDRFVLHDRTELPGEVERELELDAFPTPAELWHRYQQWRGLSPEDLPVVQHDYYEDGSGREPRYYQRIAINRTVEAIAKGQDRVLLVMATGTGKTYTAFQIIWRLWKSGAKKRILYLADRNILIDQARVNDFKPFGGQMTKIVHHRVDKSFEIYTALYQGITGTDEADDVFRQFSPDFFDLIVVDECHRGSAADDSAWRRVLEYFNAATQIGMTATPKETKDVSNIDYFGEPVYTYSLREGIEDGFLAPYKVVRVYFDKDIDGVHLSVTVDDEGNPLPTGGFAPGQVNKTVVLRKRDQLVAETISRLLNDMYDRYAKTIVFCEDIEHAERMRVALVNENADIAANERRYVMRITGDEQIGKAELDNFIDPEKKLPVIATTSRLMTTGVDAQTCKLIVLDRTINSMTEFKQIIGRGTRVNEDYGKTWFTILDFVGATALFRDPDFDGPPISVYEPNPGDPIAPPDEDPLPPEEPRIREGRKKYILGKEPVTIVGERVQFLDKNGQLITESLRDYSKKAIQEQFASLDDFLQRWSDEDKKAAVIEELEREGVFFDELAREIGADFSAFDLVCFLAYDRPPKTRRERADSLRQSGYFDRYEGVSRQVLEALLSKYADDRVDDLQDPDVLAVPPLSQMGSMLELAKAFGGPDAYYAAVRELTERLYGDAA